MVIPWCGCGRGLNIEPEYFPLNLFFLLDTFVLECPFWCREGAVWNCLYPSTLRLCNCEHSGNCS